MKQLQASPILTALKGKKIKLKKQLKYVTILKRNFKCNADQLLRYHGLHKEVSKADEEFGNVKGKSWTAVSFGKIKAGIPLLRTKGDIEGDIVGENGSSFLSW